MAVKPPDVLVTLDRILATTPENAFACRPLPRKLIARAAQEIRVLRLRLGIGVQTAEEADAEAVNLNRTAETPEL
jgi:hypothetical protein